MTLYCENCGEKIKKSDQFCPSCGGAVKGDVPPNALNQNSTELEEVQRKFIRGKSWGAALGIWWALFSRAYIYALVFLIPFINVAALVYFIFKGREKVWDLGKWKDFEKYRRRQENLDKWAKIIWGISAGLIAIIILLGVFYNGSDNTGGVQQNTVDYAQAVVNILCDNGDGGSGTILTKDGGGSDE